jgi:hypothetical protein
VWPLIQPQRLGWKDTAPVYSHSTEQLANSHYQYNSLATSFLTKTRSQIYEPPHVFLVIVLSTVIIQTYNLHIPFILTIYNYRLYLPFTIYTYNLRLWLTLIIYIYDLDLWFAPTSYTYNLHLQFTCMTYTHILHLQFKLWFSF